MQHCDTHHKVRARSDRLDFWTLGLYTDLRDAFGWTPAWLQEESGWYRTGWWTGFGLAAVLSARLIAGELGHAAIADHAYDSMVIAIGANASGLAKFMYLIRTGQGWRMIVSPFGGKWLSPTVLRKGPTRLVYILSPAAAYTAWRMHELGREIRYWLKNRMSCD